MVSLAVRFCGQPPIKCDARPLLFKAHAALDRGALIEAGCLMREALKLYLHAECQHHECLPTKKQQRSPSYLLDALTKTAPDFAGDWLREIIGYCNALAHCQFVSQERLYTCLSIMHLYLDSSPYLLQPCAAGRLQ
jgi:hypothetical protein